MAFRLEQYTEPSVKAASSHRPSTTRALSLDGSQGTPENTVALNAILEPQTNLHQIISVPKSNRTPALLKLTAVLEIKAQTIKMDNAAFVPDTYKRHRHPE